MSKNTINEFKTTAILVVIALLSLNPMSIAYAESCEKAKTEKNKINEIDKQNTDQYLFVQSVHKASIKMLDKATRTYTLTLHEVSSFVTCFTERPAKKVSLLPIEQLLSLWTTDEEQGFKRKPPNADLNGVIIGAASQDPVNFVVELTEPVYDSKAKTLTYLIKPLIGNPVNIPENVTLNHVNLFIDDVCLACLWPAKNKREVLN